MIRRWQDGLLDQGFDALGGLRVSLSDKSNDLRKLFLRCCTPNDGQHSLSVFRCQLSLRLRDDDIHLRHYLIMRNAWPSIVQAGLHLRPKPCVVRLGLCEGGEF